MKLEIGMYCYDKCNRKRGIGEVSYFSSNNNIVIRYKWGKKGMMNAVSKGNVIASQNIIDLIEIGDYVNGYKVVSKGTLSSESKKLYLAILTNDYGNFWSDKIFEQDIKTILTKEQFENNCFRIGDK